MKTSNAPQTSDLGESSKALLREPRQADHVPVEKQPIAVAADQQGDKRVITSEGWGFFNWDSGGW